MSSIAHNAVKNSLTKILRIKLLMQVDYINNLICLKDVQVSFVLISRTSKERSVIVFKVVYASLEQLYFLSSIYFLDLVNF